MINGMNLCVSSLMLLNLILQNSNYCYLNGFFNTCPAVSTSPLISSTFPSLSIIYLFLNFAIKNPVPVEFFTYPFILNSMNNYAIPFLTLS